jgi:multidrug efflux pump subunit AcrA (membrane-fusion protein)
MKRLHIALAVTVTMAGLTTLLCSFGDGRDAEVEHNASTEADRIFLARQGEFSIGIRLQGNLDAIKRHYLVCPPGRRGLEIIELASDHSKVAKGDVIVRFSSDKYEEELEQTKLSLEEANRNYDLAVRDFAMAQATALNDLRSKVDAVRNSKNIQARYKNQEAVTHVRNFRLRIERAEDGLTKEEGYLTGTETQLSNMRTLDLELIKSMESKVAGVRKRVENAERHLRNEKNAFRDFRQYGHPKRLRDLTNLSIHAKMALQRSLVTAEAKTMQLQRKLKTHEKIIAKKKEQISRLEETIAGLTLRAPVDGIVTLGNPKSWRAQELKIGSTLNQGAVVASIPDLSSFLVLAKIPEEFRSKVSLGMVANLSCKPLPDLAMTGRLKFIAPMAQRKSRWDRNSPKIYPAEIETDSNDARLTPGMTVDIEMVIDEVKDVMYLPIEAVFVEEGQSYCRIRANEAVENREIETGRSSESFVEIVKGLQEGDEVLLFKPSSDG